MVDVVLSVQLVEGNANVFFKVFGLTLRPLLQNVFLHQMQGSLFIEQVVHVVVHELLLAWVPHPTRAESGVLPNSEPHRRLRLVEGTHLVDPYSLF